MLAKRPRSEKGAKAKRKGDSKQKKHGSMSKKAKGHGTGGDKQSREHTEKKRKACCAEAKQTGAAAKEKEKHGHEKEEEEEDVIFVKMQKAPGISEGGMDTEVHHSSEKSEKTKKQPGKKKHKERGKASDSDGDEEEEKGNRAKKSKREEDEKEKDKQKHASIHSTSNNTNSSNNDNINKHSHTNSADTNINTHNSAINNSNNGMSKASSDNNGNQSMNSNSSSKVTAQKLKHIQRCVNLKKRGVLSQAEHKALTDSLLGINGQHEINLRLNGEERTVLCMHKVSALETISPYCPHPDNNQKSEQHIGMLSVAEFDAIKRALISASDEPRAKAVTEAVSNMVDAYWPMKLSGDITAEQSQILKRDLLAEVGVSV